MDPRTAPLLAVVALSCSLIVPLDYTGGKPSNGSDGGVSTTGATGGAINEGGTMSEGGSEAGGAPEGGTGGSGDEGGSGGDGGTAAMGGTGEAGGGGVGGTPSGGTPGGGMSGVGGVGGDGGGTGGDGGRGGTGGDTSGTGGDGGRGGSGVAGAAGSGGRASGGIGGNPAGAAGGGMGGKPCEFDVENDPMHCGTCTTACAGGDECIEGICVSSPCDGLCAPFTVVGHTANDGYRVTNMNSVAERCYEIASYVPVQGKAALVCWNFGSGRTLEVNGEEIPCVNANGLELTMGERVGGYCLHASAGDYKDAGFLFPDTTNF